MRSKAQDQAARDERFTKLWNEGLSTEIIAQRLGMAKASITTTRARLGLEPRRGKADWS